MNYEADFRLISDTAGFILVYPQALEDPNDGNSTNWIHKEPTNHNDIFFVEKMKIMQKPRFSFGFSNYSL